MTDQLPNIKRPIETAPRDGTKIFVWGNSKRPVVCYFNGMDWLDTDQNIQCFRRCFWSPMPQEAEHCCGELSAHVRRTSIGKVGDGWFLYLRSVPSKINIDFCPFCGERLK